jgi:hypothetical protein
MRTAFAGDAESRRAAFRAVLGDRKMQVLEDPERRFRVEGLFELPLEIADARDHQVTGRRLSEVAGGATSEMNRHRFRGQRDGRWRDRDANVLARRRWIEPAAQIVRELVDEAGKSSRNAWLVCSRNDQRIVGGVIHCGSRLASVTSLMKISGTGKGSRST